MSYSTRFDDALVFASRVHRDQTRKGGPIPYITHLLGVASLIGDHGGSEDQVIAGLLHDAVEDGVEHIPDIEAQILERFGAQVLEIVLACSDTTTHPKPPWRERKQAYIDHVEAAADDDPALLISAADKLHNLTTMLRDHDLHGDALWERFNATPEQSLWYYQRLSAALNAKQWPTQLQAQIAAQLARRVEDFAGVIDVK